jgi:hypothetical protein
MKHEVSFSAAELAGLEVKTAKTGKDYAKGVIILRNDEGKFQASSHFYVSQQQLDTSALWSSRNTQWNLSVARHQKPRATPSC